MGYNIAPAPVPAANQTQYIGDKVIWDGTGFTAQPAARIENLPTAVAADVVAESIPHAVYYIDPSAAARKIDLTNVSVSCTVWIVRASNAGTNAISLKANGATVSGWNPQFAGANTDYALPGSAIATNAGARAWLVFVDVPTKTMTVISSAGTTGAAS